MNCMRAKKSVGCVCKFVPLEIFVLAVAGSGAVLFVGTSFIWQFLARKDVSPIIGGCTKEWLEIFSALSLIIAVFLGSVFDI